MLWDSNKNTAFFHFHASKRRDVNRIEGLNDKNGNWVTEVEDLALGFFKKTLYNSHGVNRVEELLDCMDSITTHDMNDFLSQPFSREEVRTALKQMPHTKALGLDGVHAFFNQKYWRIIGRDIDNFCLDLLNGD